MPILINCQSDNHHADRDSSDKIITIVTILDCSPEIAFGYFSENELLEKWLTAKADVVMKPGGKFELFWTPDDPDLTNNSTYGCKVLAVDKPNYLNIEWKGNAEQKSFMNSVRPLTNVTVIFTKMDSTRTKVTLVHTGWRLGEEWEATRLYFTNAWSGALMELETLVNKDGVG
ncbi:MAG: SRPBCC domain-containing protein [Cyclobacteriaceae bacterium]